MTFFEGTGFRTTKMTTFFLGNWLTNTVLKFFPQKNPTPSDLNPKNWFCGHVFPHIYDSIGPIVSKNNRIHL